MAEIPSSFRASHKDGFPGIGHTPNDKGVYSSTVTPENVKEYAKSEKEREERLLKAWNELPEHVKKAFIDHDAARKKDGFPF